MYLRSKCRCVSDGSQQDHGCKQAIAGDLHQVDHLIGPGLGVAQFGQFLVDLGFLGFQLGDDLQVELYLETSQFAEFLFIPPGLVLIGQQVAFRGRQVEALEHAMQAVLPKGIGTMLDIVICLPKRQRKEISERSSRTGIGGGQTSGKASPA